MLFFRLGVALAGLALLLGGTLIGRDARAAEVSEHVTGDANAPVTIIEYASLGCPHCAAFQAETLPQLKARYLDTGKAKLVFRDFPLDELALRAAMLAHCAGPERYGKFVDVFFKQQPSWERAQDPLAAIKQLAKLGGLSDDAIQACLSDKSLEDAILQSRLQAQQKYGVDSTPTFIITSKASEQPKKIAGNQPIDDFAKVIDPLLQ